MDRTKSLDAANLSTTTSGGKKARHREHNYGYSVGGPIYIPKIYDGRNKTFFFTNLEKDDRNEQQITGLGTVPTARVQERGLLEIARSGVHRQSRNPAHRWARTHWVAQSFSVNSTTPAPRGVSGMKLCAIRSRATSSPRVVGIRWRRTLSTRSGLPTPPRLPCCGIYPTINGSPVFNLESWGVKIDHQINSANQISGYYNHSYRSRYNNGAGRFLPYPGPASSSWQQQITPGHLARLSLTSTLSPSIINRVAAGFNRFLNRTVLIRPRLTRIWLNRSDSRICPARCSRSFLSTDQVLRCRATPSLAWASALSI